MENPSRIPKRNIQHPPQHQQQQQKRILEESPIRLRAAVTSHCIPTAHLEFHLIFAERVAQLPAGARVADFSALSGAPGAPATLLVSFSEGRGCWDSAVTSRRPRMALSENHQLRPGGGETGFIYIDIEIYTRMCISNPAVVIRILVAIFKYLNL